jgi:geranylgeranyl pyrophosphate synthase
MSTVEEAISPTAALEEVERRIDRFFDESQLRSARGFTRYEDLWRGARAAATGGKRLRPRLVVVPYLLLGGTAPRPAVELAAAVELLHTALLLHDDVIDRDLERRGAPNLAGSFARDARAAGVADDVARGWGESAAILAGDLLLSAAVRLAAGIDVDAAVRDRILQLVDESVFRAASGELADVAYAAGLDAPSAAAIREMMADKTAHYSLELPLRAAAILAGATEELVDRLGAIGRSLGLVFQMRDDLLGVFGDGSVTGKSTTSDLREGKRTLLVAFAHGTEEWARAAPLFGRPDLDDAGAARLREALELSGARGRLEQEVRNEQDAARSLIRDASLPATLGALLEDELDRAGERRA